LGTPRKKNEPKENIKEIGFKLGEKYFGNHLNLNEMFFVEVEINAEWK